MGVGEKKRVGAGLGDGRTIAGENSHSPGLMSGSENWLVGDVELLGERFCVLKDGCGHRRQRQGHCAIRKRRRTGVGRKHRRRSMQRQDGFGREERGRLRGRRRFRDIDRYWKKNFGWASADTKAITPHKESRLALKVSSENEVCNRNTPFQWRAANLSWSLACNSLSSYRPTNNLLSSVGTTGLS